MQTRDEGKLVHIQLEDEEEQAVLRSLIKSSYALAKPQGELNQLIADPCHDMRDSEADDFIMAPRIYDDCVIDISVVNGRECKTRVYRLGPRLLAVDKARYERFRTDLNSVLDRTKLMIAESSRKRQAAAVA